MKRKGGKAHLKLDEAARVVLSCGSGLAGPNPQACGDLERVPQALAPPAWDVQPLRPKTRLACLGHDLLTHHRMAESVGVLVALARNRDA